MKKNLLKILKIITLQLVSFFFVLGTVVFALSLPINIPVGETVGGTFMQFFNGIYGSCPDGEVLKGFNDDFSKNCIASSGVTIDIWDDGINYFTYGTLITYNPTAVGLSDSKKTNTEAKAYCNDLSLGGKEDWYLPSKDQLNTLYLNNNTIGGFEFDRYWSDTLFGSNNKRRIRFTDGWSDYINYVGSTSFYVRCVRTAD